MEKYAKNSEKKSNAFLVISKKKKSQSKKIIMVLKKEKGKWMLYSRKTHRRLGIFKTKKEALRRERQIAFFKKVNSTQIY